MSPLGWSFRSRKSAPTGDARFVHAPPTRKPPSEACTIAFARDPPMFASVLSTFVYAVSQSTPPIGSNLTTNALRRWIPDSS